MFHHRSDSTKLKHQEKEIARCLAVEVSHDDGEDDDDEHNNGGDRDAVADGNVWHDEDDSGPHCSLDPYGTKLLIRAALLNSSTIPSMSLSFISTRCSNNMLSTILEVVFQGMDTTMLAAARG